MAWTEQDYQEIVARLKKDSQGVGDVPEAESLDGITSLPAFQEVEGQDIPNVRRAPLSLLAAPALEAAEKADKAAANADEKASAAETATQSANEAATNTNEAIQNAKTATDAANASASSANQATENANTAASNANSKASLADTAAANADETAENPTRIGEDHYVYVYNKETKTFDKTNIYCKGEPGSPFKPVGQYDTLELLKQAIPDGSDVDGMIAVGTEAPYDYYAWLNGEWVSQGKMGDAGNIVVFPNALLNLTSSSTSDQILDIFGGLGGFKGIANKLRNNDCIVVCGNKGDSYRSVFDNYIFSYTDDANFTLHLYDNSATYGTPKLIYLGITLTDNAASLTKKENNIPFVSDVLTKTNTSPFTPTGDYQPATKKYVDITTTKFVQLGTSNLNDFVGSDSEGFIGVQTYGANATLDRNYPIAESGMLICAGSINRRTNQIYQTFNSNRTFTRGAGINEFTPWKELVGINDVLTKDNTTEYTPTSDYNPAPKAYVDNSISNSRSVGYMMQLTEIDASGLDENTWYPVVISLGNRNTVRIEVIVGLDSGTKPSWSTHDQGFSVRKIWEVNGLGWGTSPVVNHQVFVSDYVFADTDPVRGLGQLSNTSEEYVFVRGGGKYFFYTSHGVIPELKTETYEGAGGQSVSPTTETPAEIVANMATKEYVDEKVSNIFDLEGFDFKTATQSKKEEFIQWVKGTNQVAHIIHDEAQPKDDLYIPVSSYKHGDYGVGEEIILNFIAIDCYSLSIDAYIYINVYNSDSGVIDLNSTASINIKRYNIDPDSIKRNIITSDNLTTITKKTSGEYEALTKDGKTMYAVTD